MRATSSGGTRCVNFGAKVANNLARCAFSYAVQLPAASIFSR